MIVGDIRISNNNTVIAFTHDGIIEINTFLKVMHDGKNHYFQVQSMNSERPYVYMYTAGEVGYWATRFNRLPKVDPSTVVGAEITIVDDPKEGYKISEMTCWC